MEHKGKRKAEPRQIVRVSAKKPKGFDYRSKGQQGRNHCGKCGRSHDGVSEWMVRAATSATSQGNLARIVLLLSPLYRHQT